MSLTTTTFASFERPAVPYAMRRDHTPTGGLGHWTALSIASVLGANGGDLFTGGLGALAGLPLLAAGFAASLLAERRSTRPTQAYYWPAMLFLRVAATNVAGLLGHAFGPVALAGVAAALAGALFVKPPAQSRGAQFPAVDARYWTRMMLAGTLGASLGDLSSFMFVLGSNVATLALGAAVAVLIGLRSYGFLPSAFAYWGIVVVTGIAGTALGDLSASQIGLAQSGAVWMVVLLTTLFFRTKRPAIIAPAFA